MGVGLQIVIGILWLAAILTALGCVSKLRQRHSWRP
jgi:hypothetical protein